MSTRFAAFLLAGVATATLVTPASGHAAPPEAAQPSTGRAPVESGGPERRLYMITDSVGLGAAPAIRDAFAGWQVTIDADPGEFTETLERKYVAPRLTTSPWAFGDHAIVATGYNYPYWDPDRFDRSIDSMIATLQRAGVKHVHWVTLREVREEHVSPSAWRQAAPWRWYLPIVNGHLERALERHPNLRLVDWAAVADQPGVTYDAIHLNNAGAALYSSITRRSVDEAATAIPDGGVARVRVPDAAGVGAVAVNVTTTGPRTRGFLTAWNCDGPQPTASFHNYVRDEVVAHATIVPVNSAGEFCLATRAATNVVVDLTGRFPTGDGYRPVGPTRWIDTRSTGSSVPAAGRLQLDLAAVDLAGSERKDVAAVAISLTATGTSAPGFLTATTACSGDVTSSNVNYLGDDTIPNLVIVEPDADGRICVFSLVESDVVVDLLGVFDESAGVLADAPVRAHDSRAAGTRLSGGGVLEIAIDDTLRGAVLPAAPVDPAGVVVNLTAVGAGAPGFVAAYPCDEPSTGTSMLNMPDPDAVSNAALVAPDASLRLCVQTSVETDLVVDVMGTIGAGFTGGPPVRLLDTRATG